MSSPSSSCLPLRLLLRTLLALCSLVILGFTFALIHYNAAPASVAIESFVAVGTVLALVLVTAKHYFSKPEDQRKRWLEFGLMMLVLIGHLIGTGLLTLNNSKLTCRTAVLNDPRVLPPDTAFSPQAPCNAFKGLAAAAWTEVALSFILMVVALSRDTGAAAALRAATDKLVSREAPHTGPDVEKAVPQDGVGERWANYPRPVESWYAPSVVSNFGAATNKPPPLPPKPAYLVERGHQLLRATGKEPGNPLPPPPPPPQQSFLDVGGRVSGPSPLSQRPKRPREAKIHRPESKATIRVKPTYI